MKINQNKSPAATSGKSKNKNAKKSAAPTKAGFFQTLFDKQEPLPLNTKVDDLLNFEELFSELEDLGKELSLRKSMAAMERYRGAIKKILQDLIPQGMESVSFQGGQTAEGTKYYHLTRVVDENLMELAEKVMSNEKNHMEIAATVDNIKGVLIDYFK